MRIDQPFLRSFTFALMAFVLMAVKIALTESDKVPEKAGAALVTCLVLAVLVGLFWRWASFGPKRGAWIWVGATYVLFFVGIAGCRSLRHVQ